MIIHASKSVLNSLIRLFLTAMQLGIEIVAYLQDPSRIDGDFRNGPLPNIRLGFQEKVEAFEEL